MSGTGEVTADFAGEERAFRIRLGEIRRIEAKCGNDGIGEILRRLARAAYALNSAKDAEGNLDMLRALASGIEIRADDVRTPIYEGLRGAGVADAEATKIIRVEIDDRGVQGLIDSAPTALLVLLGSQEAPPGEPQAGESPATPPNPSTSESSTESEPPSA